MLHMHKPALEELDFRRRLLQDPETMAYNRAWGGTIDFPPERWPGWYERWLAGPEGQRFYRFLCTPEGEPVGEAAYHRDGHMYLCDVIILARHRGRGYGGEGLELLCAAARENGVGQLYDNIAADNQAALGLFLGRGFRIAAHTPEAVLVKKDLGEAPPEGAGRKGAAG